MFVKFYVKLIDGARVKTVNIKIVMIFYKIMITIEWIDKNAIKH